MRNFVMNVAALVLLLGMIGIAGYDETHYQMNAEVVAVYKDEVVVEDTTGNLWGYETNDLAKGDNVKVVFHTMGTTAREDDKIEKILKK